MPQVNKTVNTSFVGGLNTEASLLNFPPNHSVDELNCELRRSGIREPRKGVEFDSSGSLSTWTLTQGQPTAEFVWKNVSGQIGLEFAVIQIGATIRFYDKSYSPLSGGEKSFTVNLNSYSAGNSYIISEERISAATIGPRFVVASPAIETIVIEYDPDADSITVTEIAPKVRDFDWQGTTTGYYDKAASASVTAARKYDTFNAGWVSNSNESGGSDNRVLDRYQSDNGGAWPPLNSPWYAGKDATDGDKFKTDQWTRVGRGNTLIANGHFILNLYNKDRVTAYNDHPLNTETALSSGDIPTETESNRFSAVVGYAGRAWFSGIYSNENGSKLFFTKVITSLEDFDKFYTVNDPTSEDLSDPLDNDGGVIEIQQAGKIRALFEFGSSLLVFAENGVWEVKGVDQVFKATEFSVMRVRDTDGLLHPATLVDVEGTPIWWGKTGIFSVQADQVNGTPSGVDISKETVQTFWENIGAAYRARAKGVYDALNKRVMWFYGNSAVNYKYNGILILDTVLQAFYPWLITDEAANTNYIVGAIYSDGSGVLTAQDDVEVNTDQVQVNGDDVYINVTQEVTSENTLILILRDGDTGKVGFGGFTADEYLDWGTRDYSAFAEAAYIFDGDVTTRKRNVKVSCVFNRTETGFTGTTPNFEAINPSACTMSAYWDGKSTASTSKQVYKLRKQVMADEGDLTVFDYPYDTVITRNLIRGRGHWLKLRFENTPGKMFQLYGYEVLDAKNSGI